MTYFATSYWNHNYFGVYYGLDGDPLVEPDGYEGVVMVRSVNRGSGLSFRQAVGGPHTRDSGSDGY